MKQRCQLLHLLCSLVLACLLTGCASTLPQVEAATYRNAGVITQLHKTTAAEQAPLILLFSGGGKGGMSGSKKTIARFNAQGFHVVSVGYFGLQGIGASEDRIDIDQIHQAIIFYKNQDYVLPEKIAVHGFSLGAQLALLLASEYPEDVNAVIALMPSHVVFQASSISWTAHSSWTRAGTEVAFVPWNLFSLTSMKAAFSSIGDTHKTQAKTLDFVNEALQNKDAEKKAVIQVEKIKGPILLVSAIQDQSWPSTAMAEKIMLRLQEQQFSYKYTHEPLDVGHNDFFAVQSVDAVTRFLTEFKKSNEKE